MRILVKDYTVEEGPRYFTFNVEPSDLTVDVQAEIQALRGIPVRKQAIRYTRTMYETYTFQDYGVQQDSTLTLSFRQILQPERLMLIMTPTAQVITLSENDWYLKMEDIKVKLQDQIGIPADQQRWMWGGRELADGKRFWYYRYRYDEIGDDRLNNLTVDGRVFIFRDIKVMWAWETAFELSRESTGGIMLDKYIGPPVKSVFIPKSVSGINNYCFNGCKFLSQIIFEEGSNIDWLGHCAFAGTGLKKIQIPKSVSKICCLCFQGTSLSEISFEEGSKLNGVCHDVFKDTAVSVIRVARGDKERLRSLLLPEKVEIIEF